MVYPRIPATTAAAHKVSTAGNLDDHGVNHDAVGHNFMNRW